MPNQGASAITCLVKVPRPKACLDTVTRPSSSLDTVTRLSVFLDTVPWPSAMTCLGKLPRPTDECLKHSDYTRVSLAFSC